MCHHALAIYITIYAFLAGYVIKMEYNRETGDTLIKTVSLLGLNKRHQFNISEAGPPSKATAFSTFQARGKSYFMHTEVFEDRALLNKILGAYSVFEDPKTWSSDPSTDTSRTPLQRNKR